MHVFAAAYPVSHSIDKLVTRFLPSPCSCWRVRYRQRDEVLASANTQRQGVDESKTFFWHSLAAEYFLVQATLTTRHFAQSCESTLELIDCRDLFGVDDCSSARAMLW